jgi:hypothetical protein
MQRWICCGLMVVAGLAGRAAYADEGDIITGGWYVSPMLQYDNLDKHRAADSGVAGDVAGGYNIVRHFAVEANYSYGDFTIPNVGHQAMEQFTVDGLVKFLPRAIVDPYFIVGAGVVITKYPGLSEINSGAVEAGVGALTGLGDQTGSFRIQLRTEAKYRREWIQNQPFDPKNPGDILIGVGVQFEFGAPTPPPQTEPPGTVPRI